jgi:hypothetical protein
MPMVANRMPTMKNCSKLMTCLPQGRFVTLFQHIGMRAPWLEQSIKPRSRTQGRAVRRAVFCSRSGQKSWLAQKPASYIATTGTPPMNERYARLPVLKWLMRGLARQAAAPL